MSEQPEEYFLPGGRISINDLPKISLHDHLDGGLRAATIVELADQGGVTIPETDPKALAEWFEDSADSGSLPDYLATFEVTLGIMQSADNLIRVAREYVQDLTADGVIYGEVRWAPELHLRAGLELDEAVEAVQTGIEAGIDDARAAGRFIRVGQLLTAMRRRLRLSRP
jgi:adenosine deaminase